MTGIMLNHCTSNILVNVIYNSISKTLVYHCKGSEKLKVLLLGTTRISTVNIGGTTIHSDYGVKPGTKALGLSNKSKAALRNRLSEVKILVIDYTVSSARNDVAVLDKLDAHGVFIFSFMKHNFSDRVVILVSLYRKQSIQMQEFFQMLS